MVDGDISVRQGHDLAHEVKDSLIDAIIGLVDVTVHVEPWETEVASGSVGAP